MQEVTSISRPDAGPDCGSAPFYRHVLETLHAQRVPFLIGGAYAFNHYTGINRFTKDLDIFIRRADYELVSQALEAAGYMTELTFPHWLGKAHCDDLYIDLIFSSGNGVAEVDDAWFVHAGHAQVMDIPTLICPVEEMIWSKAFIMERERYDGADIAHLLRARAERMDWPRLLHRFDQHWRVLLSHLVLFGYVYPAQRDLVPAAVMDKLLEHLQDELQAGAPPQEICMGTLLSREQFLSDIEQQGLQDGRIAPLGKMTAEEIAIWTGAIQPNPPP